MPANTIDHPEIVSHVTQRVKLGKAKTRKTGTLAEAFASGPSREQLDQRQAAMRTRRRPGPPLEEASSALAESADEPSRPRVPPTGCTPPPSR